MTRFGYALMAEQGGTKDLVRQAVVAEEAGFDFEVCSVAANAPMDYYVYQPLEDSRLLIQALRRCGPMANRRAVDLCTGTGVVAIEAARLGARTVTAYDLCPRAVRATRMGASMAGVQVAAHLGSWMQAMESEPFDLVTCNPPYVPITPEAGGGTVPVWAGPTAAWNGGPDGRLVLDPLCAVAADMLTDRGTLLMVQSELAGIDESLAQLRQTGMRAGIVATERIPFGPVLTSQARWLESSGRLARGRRDELLVVIKAVKP